jgi:LPS export ABC transporter protein LptC
MISRKKRIILIQSFLLVFGIALIFFTYSNLEKDKDNEILNEVVKNKIQDKNNSDKNTSNIFYDIEYSGIDLSGNRYILRAGEAMNNETEENIVILREVNATFYFKDNKILKVSSDFGKYNNKTLDMFFEKNVLGNYDGSTLNAEKASYLNSQSYIVINENVIINDIRGSMNADKLVFDLNKNKLDISSSKKKKIKTNIIYK